MVSCLHPEPGEKKIDVMHTLKMLTQTNSFSYRNYVWHHKCIKDVNSNAKKYVWRAFMNTFSTTNEGLPLLHTFFFFFFIDSTITTTLILIKLRGYRYTHVYVKSFRFTQHMLQGLWSWTRFILEGAQSHQPSMVIYQSPDNLSCIHTHLFNCAFRHSHVIMHRGGKSEDWYIWNDTYVYVATG